MSWPVMFCPCLACPVHASVIEKHGPVMARGGVVRVVMMPRGIERLNSVRATRFLFPCDSVARDVAGGGVLAAGVRGNVVGVYAECSRVSWVGMWL